MLTRLHAWTSAATLLTLVAVVQVRLSAQPVPSVTPVTLAEAIEFATRTVPAVRATDADVSAARRGRRLARASYWPTARVRFGLNRATRNNVFGLTLPNGIIPAISGPVLDRSTGTSTFGSTLGILISWEPFDFGLRGANMRVADAIETRADARRRATAYRVSLRVADAYLLTLAKRQAVEAAAATVDRMRVFAEAVGVMVRNELRPGADESRAQAELTTARIAEIRAGAEADAALVALTEAMGLAGEPLQLRPGRLLHDPPAELLAAAPSVTPVTRPSVTRHPIAAAQDAEVAVADARTLAAARRWRPTVQIQSAVYGRGTGAGVDGTFAGGAGGLAPSERNWAVGVNVTFDLLGFVEHRARHAMERDRAEHERALGDEIAQRLTGDLSRARISLDAATQIAQTTPVALDAARTLEAQAAARYRAGLGTVVEVAEAQRLLRQAEVDAALARLGVWRALFELGAATGDMDALLRASSF